MKPLLHNIPWIDSPLFERELEASALDAATRELARRFARDGAIVIDLGLSDFESLSQEIITRCSTDPRYVERIQDGWEQIEAIRTLACAPQVLTLLGQLYGRAAIPMQSLNFARGTEQRAHADAFHFHSHPAGFMCGVWVALEDIDEHNGPLEYFPGSHRLPYLDNTHLGKLASSQRNFEFYADYEDMLQRLIAELELERRVLHVPRGTALLWHANLLHGGQPVRDPARTRHSQVTHYYFEDCSYFQPQRSDPMLGRVEWLYKRDVRNGHVIPHSYDNRRIHQLQTRLRTWSHNSALGRALLKLRQRTRGPRQHASPKRRN